MPIQAMRNKWNRWIFSVDVCHEHECKLVMLCTEDGIRPPEVGLQE